MIIANVFSAIGGFLRSVWPYLVAILLFLVMIFIHEFGHFIAAKLMGVKVNEFAIGFGPALFKKQGKETLYAVRAIPFGGFCAMEGEDESSENDRAFCNKPAWRRFIIIVAGAFMNIVLGLIIVMIIMAPSVYRGNYYGTTRIHSFPEGSVSADSGLEVGDKILEVNGRRVYTYMEMNYCFSNVKESFLDLEVLRNGKREQVRYTFPTEVIDGINYVKADFVLVGEEKTFGNYIKHGLATTVSYGRMVWFSLVDLVTGKFGISQVSGPVGVTQAIGTAAKTGLLDLLPMIALITINLGIFNLLPVPALDGGRAFFLIIEMIIRRPIPKKFEAAVHAAGLVLLLGFIAIITVKDVIGLF